MTLRMALSVRFALFLSLPALAAGFFAGTPFSSPLSLRGAWTGGASPATRVCPLQPPRAALRAGGGAGSVGWAMGVDVERRPALANPEYGETGGAILSVEGVFISGGARDILVDASMQVMTGERVGLVGQNGAGKSTLLSAVAGRRLMDGGKALVKPGVSVGYLVQTAVQGSERTAWDEAASGMERIQNAEAALSAAQTALDAVGDGDAIGAAAALAKAFLEWEAAGGDTQDQKVARVLDGLGFPREDHNKSAADFSGGWQMRIALARLLLSEPDLLLLDEPTNHLDAQAKVWLQGYLSDYRGTIVIVSHEESLLEGARCTSIVEVRDRTLHSFKCSYSKYLLEREERAAQALRAYEAQQREVEKLQGFIDKFGAGTRAASATSRKKQLERMDILDAPEGLDSGRAPKLVFPPPPKCRLDMVRLKKATFGWEPETPIHKDVTLTVERGMRLAILGANGAGKSTLLWAIAGKLGLTQGDRMTTEGLRLGLFTQDLAQQIDPAKVALEVVMETVQESDAGVTFERCRAVMGALGLTKDKPLQTVGSMSGGEKARVALSMFVLVPHNLLLLDEPSNHLDVATVRTLVTALKDYEGTVAVVTHNRVFCDQFGATHVALIIPGSPIVIEERPIRPSDWEAIAKAEAAQKIKAPNVEEKAAKAESYQDMKKRGNAPKRIEKLGQEVEKLEAQLAKLDAEMVKMGADVEKVMGLQAKKEEVEGKVAALYEEWEELEALLAP